MDALGKECNFLVEIFTVVASYSKMCLVEFVAALRTVKIRWKLWYSDVFC